jgi:chitinase
MTLRSRRAAILTAVVVAVSGAAVAIVPMTSSSAAVSCAGLTAWAEGSSFTTGQKVTYNGRQYDALVAHTAWAGTGWNPAATPSLWRDVDACSSTNPPTTTRPPTSPPTTTRPPTTPPTTPPVTPTTPPVTNPPSGSLPKHFVTGYWHNFNNGSTVLKLRDVPSTYDLIAVAFADAASPAGAVDFNLDPAVGYANEAEFKADINTLHSRGKKVILSVGGERGTVDVGNATNATNFANSLHSLIQEFGFDGVDIDLEHGISPTFMGQAMRSLRSKVGTNLIITMAPQTIDMYSTGGSYFQLALNIKDILTVVHTQYYNSGGMPTCNGSVQNQATKDFIVGLACYALENGLRPDQVALGLPATQQAAGGGYVSPSVVNEALSCLARGTNCGSVKPPRTYPGIRGAMTWSINWDVATGNNWANTVKPHVNGLP